MKEPVIVVSNLSRSYTEGEMTVDVQIYRIEPAAGWTLEIIENAETSVVWSTQFATDRAAWEEFESGVQALGLERLLNVDEIESVTVH